MKKISFLAFFLFIILDANSQSIDSIACKKVEDTLRIIEKYIIDPHSDPQLRRIAAANFLVEISDIPYEGGVSFLGAESPKKSFYLKCVEWFICNKSKVRWDENEKKIIFKVD